MKAQKFHDKVVIVTGSSRGIGKATAIELAKNGASVVLNGRDQTKLSRAENEIRTYSDKVLAVCSDVSIPAEAKNIIDRTIETFGKLDILINNAALSMRGRFSDLNPEVFKSIFETNLLGVINCTIPAVPHIRDTRGSIVFISSLAGIRGLPIQSAYCSSKMALRGIAESIRVEEAKSKIHVGLVLVGITEIEPEKTVISEDGSLIVLNERTIFKDQSMLSAAMAILKNIRKRRSRSILTGMGKALAIFQSIVPGMVEKLLIYSTKKKVRY